MAEARQILNEIILENLPELLTATDTERSSEPTEDQIRQWKKTLRLEIASVEELNSSSEERENLHKTISENLPNILREKKPEIEDQISDWKVKMALENVPDVSLTSPSINFNWFKTLHSASSPGLPPPTILPPSSISFTGSRSNIESLSKSCYIHLRPSITSPPNVFLLPPPLCALCLSQYHGEQSFQSLCSPTLEFTPTSHQKH
ncbi:uncharacterized protein LOC121939610 isoform X2 [Plectropomus leopardus]|uniref:uncharacterized protein LOC121939610 isoform X2 n=1 Tax=Plectropomus leopardus TaxID=160734 RepID=UPI001C4C798E|nr:uncharacterized protein LOC121939610 isoform X2 [Plectropomus leopardus]